MTHKIIDPTTKHIAICNRNESHRAMMEYICEGFVKRNKKLMEFKYKYTVELRMCRGQHLVSSYSSRYGAGKLKNMYKNNKNNEIYTGIRI